MKKEVFSRKLSGVISIFGAISFVLILSLLMALLENTRILGMHGLVEKRCDIVTDEVFSNYQLELYKDYGILAIDSMYSQYGEDEQLGIKKRLEECCNKKNDSILSGMDYYDTHAEVGDIHCMLLSDQNGKGLMREICQYVTCFLPEEEKAIEGEYEEILDQEEEVDGLDIQDILQDAIDGLQEEEKSSPKLEKLQEKMGQPVFSLIFGEKREESLSNGTINEAYWPSHRKLCNGDLSYEMTGSKIGEKAALLLYINQFFASYTDHADRTDLAYEMEYLIAGGKSDKQNLESVAKRMLLIRQGLWFAYLLTDSAEVAKAQTEATAIVAATGMLPLEEVVKMGLLLAKAFDYALSDVRSLLNGNKIDAIPKNPGLKISYTTYLWGFLTITSEKKLLMRMLDLMENRVNAEVEYGSFYVDQSVIAIKGNIQFSMHTLFEKAVLVPHKKMGHINFQQVIMESYEKAKL